MKSKLNKKKSVYISVFSEYIFIINTLVITLNLQFINE